VFAQAQGSSKTPSKSSSLSTPTKQAKQSDSPFATPSFLRGGSTTKAWSVEDSELFNEQTIFSPAAPKPVIKMDQIVVEKHIVLDSPLSMCGGGGGGDLPSVNFKNEPVELDPIGKLLLPDQERAIIDDLLFVIMVYPSC
jgi:hypothetical protein